MKVYLKEITDQDTDLHYTQEETWVAAAVKRVDEKLDPKVEARLEPPLLAERKAEIDLTLRKVDEVVVISGNIDTAISLYCSRCAAPFLMPCHTDFSALFCKDPVMAGVAHLEKDGKPVGHVHGKARHAHDFEADEEGASDLSSTNKDLDITYLAEDYIDLADVVTEQIQFQVPFQPLCKEECRGICSNCGADLNLETCSCATAMTARPLAALRNLKLK